MKFDFKLNESTSCIEKDGYYSRCRPHEASREEVILWLRVKELESIVESKRPEEVRDLLRIISNSIGTVLMNVHDFVMLKDFASDKIRVVSQPILVEKGLVGEMPVMNDGSPSTIWIKVDKRVQRGEIKTEELGTKNLY